MRSWVAAAFCLAFAAILWAGLPPAPATAQTLVAMPQDPTGAISFVMPSGNIACIYTPAGGSTVFMPLDGGPELACDRAEPVYLRFVLAASGPAYVMDDVGDPSCCGGTNAFPYGTEVRFHPFTCVSAQTGLACQRTDGHGFFISRARIAAY